MSFSIQGLDDLERSYRKAASLMARAEARAVRRSGVSVVAQQARAIAQVVNLKVSTIKKSIRTMQQPSAGQPRITFEVRGEGIALREFGARQTGKGVSVLVLRASGRKIVADAFMARGYGNNLQVFRRTGGAKRVMKAGRYTGKLREPIEKLYGPDVMSQYVKDAIQQAGADTWNARLPIELEHECDRALSEAGLI